VSGDAAAGLDVAAMAGKCGGVATLASSASASARSGPEEMEASIFKAGCIFVGVLVYLFLFTFA
jgi:hypothetical protein